MIYLLLIVIVLFILLFFICAKMLEGTEIYGHFVIILITVVLIILFTVGEIIIILWCDNYSSSTDSILEYNQIKNEIENTDYECKSYDNFNLCNKTDEINEKLKDAKYWNSTFIEDIIPDDFASLPYLENDNCK